MSVSLVPITHPFFEHFDFPEIVRNSIIGFDDLLSIFDDIPAVQTKYPPYNIIRKDDSHKVIEMAVAGFKPEDIHVSTKDNVLTISGESSAKEDNVNEISQYEYRGISSRSFHQGFRLYEFHVETVEFENGMLRVTLEQEIPEKLKEKTFPISVKK
ncbi:Small heat shock protein IbpA [uncultured archaeon]|nr:Small heat shock protein IbpA [uncultured archaeon]